MILDAISKYLVWDLILKRILHLYLHVHILRWRHSLLKYNYSLNLFLLGHLYVFKLPKHSWYRIILMGKSFYNLLRYNTVIKKK